jgi:hypothetical protein
MRDQSDWHRLPAAHLKDFWPEGRTDLKVGELLDVELGLYVLAAVMPGRPAIDAWTLFGGYPYSEAFGDVDTDAKRLMIRRARRNHSPLREARRLRVGEDGSDDVTDLLLVRHDPVSCLPGGKPRRVRISSR